MYIGIYPEKVQEAWISLNFNFIKTCQVLNYLGISQTSQTQNGPSLFKLFQACCDANTGHMTLIFEIFCRRTANWQGGNRQVWSGNIYTIVRNLVALHVYRYNYA